MDSKIESHFWQSVQNQITRQINTDRLLGFESTLLEGIDYESKYINACIQSR